MSTREWTRRERAVEHIRECRQIHADWIEDIRAGRATAEERRIGGGISWHKKWVGHYNLVLRELGEKP